MHKVSSLLTLEKEFLPHRQAHSLNSSNEEQVDPLNSELKMIRETTIMKTDLNAEEPWSWNKAKCNTWNELRSLNNSFQKLLIVSSGLFNFARPWGTFRISRLLSLGNNWGGHNYILATSQNSSQFHERPRIQGSHTHLCGSSGATGSSVWRATDWLLNA